MRAFIHHLFFPKESNNFRAKALHINVLTVYLVLAMALSFVTRFNPSESKVLGVATDISIPKLLQLTNEQRTHQGLGTVTYNEQLSQAAQKKAHDMFVKNYWAHFGPNGETPWDFILSAGYQYEYAGENLAKNFLFTNGVVDAWMKSPTHRENLLRREYNDVGFAVQNGVLNGEETTLVVQMFGTPLAGRNVRGAQPTPAVENTKNNVLAKTTTASVSPRISYNISLIFTIFILIALSIDFYVAAKLNIFRVHGKNLAHFIFITFILLGLLVVAKGAIL